ncbi:MAG TPA: nuclear transport factor 2 family protein [Solirubrobacterales bacterium]
MRHSPEAPVSKWIDAFNVRDLDGMLACMSDDVRFYPLRLDGLERYYRGHDGVREWFAQLDKLGHRYRIDLRNIRGERDGEVVAIGELLREGDAAPTRFWARDQVEDGLIVVAHHYLTDPDVFDSIDPSQRRPLRSSRFPGL